MESVAQARLDLTAAFRWAARLGWHEAVANHFSVAVSDDGAQFLLNPRGRHFSRMRASELLLLDARTKSVLSGKGPPDPTGWHIHGRIHAKLPQARCVLHVHSRYVTALASIKDGRLLPCDQNSMRFYDRIAYDESFAGMALDEEEGDRLCRALGNRVVLIMRNHGVIVVGASVAEAFDELYYLERACENQIIAMSSGRPLHVVSDEVARITCHQWREYPADYANEHFDELKRILDEDEPAYAC
ncbi:MAG: aldolase [Proteobacteria bacterium]|nr:aldolase [Pseudomonadota bacterium]